MKHNNIGKKIIKARQALQLSQTVLCEKTAISQGRLSQLERGRRPPSREEWAQLSQHLNLGPYPGRPTLLAPLGRWSADSPILSSAERPFVARSAAARYTFPTEMESVSTLVALRNDAKSCYEFLEAAALDSGDEAYFYLRLLAEGARPCHFSPTRAGFRTSPIVDPLTKKVIGDLRRPCLELKQECLVFPQTSILVGNRLFRLDALICVRCPKHRVWIDLEIDGPGHRSELDKWRERNLQLPTLRLSRNDLISTSLLLEKLLNACREIREKRRNRESTMDKTA